MSKMLTGTAALRDPYFTQGTAFSKEDREKYKLRGLLPPRVLTIELQAKRVMERVRATDNPLEKYELLDSLRHRCRTLYFYVIINNIDELMPIVYTPTVGKACMDFDHIFRNTDGLYVSIEDKGHVAECIANCPQEQVDMIVVTDGERILGLGDLGTGGMGIPKGKLALYTACAGLHPERTLPVCIDVGTNNQNLLKSPLYLGLQQNRIDGDQYYELVEEFITEARKRWPNVIIQFEDFANRHAFELLNRWKDKVTCFNDDIQGTASVAVAGFYSAARIKGTKVSDEKILFLGAGEAALGTTKLLVEAMVAEGLTEEQARQRIFLFDSKGLVVEGREGLSKQKALFAHKLEPCTTFLDAIELIKPTAIVGVAAQTGAFNAYVLGAMARLNEQPIIFALSNPTSKAECTAREAYTYTEGKCIFACGSPFPPVELNGKTFVPRQGNNSYVFPGIGLGLVVTRAKLVPQSVFLAAAKALTETVSDEELANGSLFPSLTEVRSVSKKIAMAVAEHCYESGLAQNPRPENLDQYIEDSMYKPVYRD